MTSTNLLVLVFVLAPGFVADSTFRIIFGERHLSDFERTIRSIAFSVVGLFAYLLIAGLVTVAVALLPTYVGLQDWLVRPPFLAGFADPSGKTVIPLDARAAIVYGLTSLTTILTAITYGWLLTRRRVQDAIGAATKRATGLSAWQLLWSRFYPVRTEPGYGAVGHQERWITASRKEGPPVMGRLQAASEMPDDRDLVLADPLLWDETRKDWFAQGEKYIFIPGSNILSLSLSSAGNEQPKTGYLQDLRSKPGVIEEHYDE